MKDILDKKIYISLSSFCQNSMKVNLNNFLKYNFKNFEFSFSKYEEKIFLKLSFEELLNIFLIDLIAQVMKLCFYIIHRFLFPH